MLTNLTLAKNYLRLSLFLILTICWNTTVVSAQISGSDQPEVSIGYLSFEPYAYTMNGKPSGVLNDIIIKTFARLPYQYSLTEYPAKELYGLLTEGTIHVWIGIKVSEPEVAPTYLSKMPVMSLTLNLYGPHIPADIDLYKITRPVIALQGYKYLGLREKLEKAQPPVSFLDAATHIDGFKMLSSGQAPFILSYELPSQIAMYTIGVYEMNSSLISEAPIYYHVSKKAPNAKSLLMNLEEAFRNIHN